MLSPAFVVFSLMSLFGTFFVFVSGGLVGMWVSLELALFGFLPILNGKTVGENESAVKYFVVQSVGSGFILLSFMVVGGLSGAVGLGAMDGWSSISMLVGFMLKLGVFPLHFWFPSVMGGSSWFSCFWLSVMQKLGPFWAISGLGFEGWLAGALIFMLALTSLVGALGGLAQVQFRSLLGYSSLGQAGWMGLVVMLAADFFLVYMVIYSVLLGGLLLSLHVFNLYKVVDVPGWVSGGKLMVWLLVGSFFISLSGMPPLLGSGLKLMGIMIIIGSFPLVLGVLILSSMVSLYYYLSVFIGSVVCLGSVSSVGYSPYEISKGLVGVLMMLVVLNWLGGVIIFMVCGGLVV